MKKCIKCGEEKPLEDYHANSGTSDGKLATCKPCRIRQQREYRSAGNRDKDNKYNRSDKRTKKLYDYWDRNPEKKYAQAKVAAAIRKGIITRPNKCRCCENTKVEGHHWSYLEENILDLFWLCKACHTKEHQIIKLKGYPEERKLWLEET